jgi:hypothetical protein
VIRSETVIASPHEGIGVRTSDDFSTSIDQVNTRLDTVPDNSAPLGCALQTEQLFESGLDLVHGSSLR